MGQVRDFKMPDLGEGLESGEIVEWHVEVGEYVDLNQEICDVETAKAVVAIPCPFAGTVVERFGAVGEELEVGEPLIRIDVEKVADAADVPDEVADQLEAAEEAAPAESEAGPEGGAAEAAAEGGKRQSVLVGYGAAEGTKKRRSRSAKKKATPAAGPAGNGEARSGGVKPLAKPPVRKLAKDLGVDIAEIAPGSGDGGVITRDDVRAAAEGAPGTVEERYRDMRQVVMESTEPTTTGFRGREPGEVIPVTGIRKRIVAKMVESRTKIPEATTSVTVDCTATWDLAADLTASAQAEGHDVRITPFAIVARAAVLALRRFPTLNATLDEEAGEIRLLEPIHLGVAVDTDRGLLVPVVKDAHARTTLGIAQEMTRVARAARDGSIAPGDLTGGTFTVNNYGALGNDWGDPIINYPEAGILGVGAMNERPWVVDGELAVRRVVTITIAFDHRICDGGEAGRFVALVGDLVENPGKILLHA